MRIPKNFEPNFALKKSSLLSISKHWLTGLILSFSCAGSFAADQDLFNFFVGTNVQYDDNLFRLPSNVSPITQNGQTDRSERIIETNIGLKLDKKYGLQRFLVDASLTRNFYQTYNYLNNSSGVLNGDWIWQITPRISGNVIYDYSRGLNSFTDVTNQNLRNIHTSYMRRFDVDWRIAGGWHPTFAIYQTESRNDEPTYEGDDTNSRSAELALRYQFPSGNTITGYANRSNGEYLNHALNSLLSLDSSYDENEAGVRVDWMLTGKSTVDASLGHLSRQNKNFPVRDFAGTVGNLTYLWMPTGKINFNVTAEQSLSSYQTLVSSYLVNRAWRVVPVWFINTKFTLRGLYGQIQRNYRGDIAMPVSTRSDRLDQQSIAVEWTPRQQVFLSAGVSASHRSSTQDGLSFNDHITKISGRFTF